MRTTAVLVILLLVVGLNLGASVARAGDHAVIQPLPTACQPVSDVELSHIRGKFLGFRAHDVSDAFADFITHDTTTFRQRILYRTTPGVAAGLFVAPYPEALAAAANALGGVATQQDANFAAVTNLITAGSYLAGLAFNIGAIFKFR